MLGVPSRHFPQSMNLDVMLSAVIEYYFTVAHVHMRSLSVYV